jgi:hypothetical protein
MNVVLNLDTKVKPAYPYLGIHSDGAVVLFVSINTGMCLYDSSPYSGELYYYSEIWSEYEFEPLQGSLTLEN